MSEYFDKVRLEKFLGDLIATREIDNYSGMRLADELAEKFQLNFPVKWEVEARYNGDLVATVQVWADNDEEACDIVRASLSVKIDVTVEWDNDNISEVEMNDVTGEPVDFDLDATEL